MPELENGTQALSSSLMEIFHDSRYYFLSFVTPALVSFFALMVYTRLLSTSDFGLYNLVMASASLVNVGFFGWLGNAAVRFWAPAIKERKASEFFTTILVTLSFVAVTSSLLWYLSIRFLPLGLGKESTQCFETGTLTMVALGISSVLRGLLQAQRQVQRYTAYSVLDSVGKPIVAVTLIILAGFRARGLLLGIAIVTGGISVWETVRIVRKQGLRISSFSWAFLAKFYRYGLPVAAVGLTTWLITWTDRYLIGYFLGTGAVGVYSAGYSLVGKSLGGLVSVLQVASLPVLVLKWEDGKEKEVKDTLQTLIGMWLLIAVPIVVSIWGFRVEIVRMFLGKSFQEAATVITWLSVVSLMQGILYVIGIRPFQIIKRTGYIALFMGIASLCNVGLNFILIPRWGIIGAAVSSLLSYSIALILSYSISSVAFRIPLPWKTIWKVSCSAVGMYLVMLLTKTNVRLSWGPNMVIALTAGVLVYFILIWLTHEEIAIRIMRKLLRRVRK